MGFFSRIAALVKGIFGLKIDSLEAKHPEIAYQNSIMEMSKKYGQLKMATASMVKRRNELQERSKKAQNELSQISLELDIAVEQNQDDLAISLIQRKEFLETLLKDLLGDGAELKGDVKQAEEDVDAAKSSLELVRQEIKNLQQEKDRMLAKFADAEARKKIQESLEGLAVDGDLKALENVREHIKTAVAEVALNDEISGNDLDVRLRKLRQQAGPVQAKNKLAELKKQKMKEAETKKELQDLLSRSQKVNEKAEKQVEVHEVVGVNR